MYIDHKKKAIFDTLSTEDLMAQLLNRCDHGIIS